MSYAAVSFTHGQTLISADVQQIDDNLDAVYDYLGDVQMFFPSASLAGSEDNNHYVLRRPGDRYLWISGDGTLTIPATAVGDQSLTDSDTPTRFDLDALNVPIGALFYVSDSTWIMVTRDP